MNKNYYHRMFVRLMYSLILSLAFMVICLFFMENIKGTVWEWFNKNISTNEDTLVKTLVFVFFVISMGVFVASYMWMSLRRFAYTRKITKAVDSISKGDLTVKVPVNGNDELTYLANALNSMVDDVNMLIERDKEQEAKRQELITQIAHDLRTPLTSVMGYLKLIEKDVEMDPDLERKYLGVAVRKAEQLQNLVEDMFSYMKLCDDDFPLQKSEVRLLRLLEQVVDEMYPIFEKNGIDCEIKTNVDSLPILADGALLARLFDNLLNNAIKYGVQGKRIFVKLEEQEEQIVVTVTNYGKIIAPEDLNKVFEKFYRTDESRSSSTGGTGLGLAIAANIVRLHGGKIYCKSDEQNGTSFIVIFPSSIIIN